MTRHGTASSLNLTRSNTLRLSCLQAERTKIKSATTLSLAVDTAFVHFTEFSTLWLKHFSSP
jgi:hypothetical protein